MGSGGTGCEVCIRAVPRWSRRDRQRGVPRAAFPVQREGRCSPRADALAEEQLGGFRSLFAAFPPGAERVPARGRPSPRGSRALGLAVPGTSPLDVPPPIPSRG